MSDLRYIMALQEKLNRANRDRASLATLCLLLAAALIGVLAGLIER